MNQFDVAIVDYGIGNILSVKRAFEHCGASVMLANSPDLIRKAKKIVLPGVPPKGGKEVTVYEAALKIINKSNKSLL
jgi:glutamine amidotransferase